MDLDIRPQTIDWNPPENLPQNWRMVQRLASGAAYRSRNKLVVMLTCCVESDGRNWVHLSVSRRDRLPSWEEFTQVKELFLGKEAFAVQVFPPRSEWVNDHPYCLHLYQCLDERPLPDFRKFGTI